MGLDGNTWLMIPTVKDGLFVSLCTEFGENIMCVW